MHNANSSIADEVEAAIATGSTEKCAKTAERVTALFLASAASFNETLRQRRVAMRPKADALCSG